MVNEWIVEGAPLRVEASLVLECLFPSQASDSANAAALDKFLATEDQVEPTLYRLFGFNEAGDGYYSPNSTTKQTVVPSLDAVFGADNYIPHRRPTLGELVSTDEDNLPLRPRVWISKRSNYKGSVPGVWDGSTGTWQLIGGGYEVLKDRLGIRLTCQNPNAWKHR